MAQCTVGDRKTGTSTNKILGSKELARWICKGKYSVRSAGKEYPTLFTTLKDEGSEKDMLCPPSVTSLLVQVCSPAATFHIGLSYEIKLYVCKDFPHKNSKPWVIESKEI